MNVCVWGGRPPTSPHPSKNIRDGCKAFVCLLLAGGLTGSLYAQQPNLHFEHITTEQGLLNNSIHCIFQDRAGFLWIGTQDGLHKYDGYRFTVYRHNPDEPNSLNNNRIHAIYEDQAGALWVGTGGGGLNRFDRVMAVDREPVAVIFMQAVRCRSATDGRRLRHATH